MSNPPKTAKDVDSLIEQIQQAVDPEGSEHESAGIVSINDAKSELLRLREDFGMDASLSSRQDTTEEAWIPPQVPTLPFGVLVTDEMEGLLSRLLDSSKKRVGFCGMVGASL
eukprot:COSAG01_NODE_946_length_12533_cov_4.570532_3_plen_112_part_00